MSTCSNVEKTGEERDNKVEHKVENIETDLSSKDSKMDNLLKENAKLLDDVLYLWSQSIRNNLIFG